MACRQEPRDGRNQRSASHVADRQRQGIIPRRASHVLWASMSKRRVPGLGIGLGRGFGSGDRPAQRVNSERGPTAGQTMHRAFSRSRSASPRAFSAVAASSLHISVRPVRPAVMVMMLFLKVPACGSASTRLGSNRSMFSARPPLASKDMPPPIYLPNECCEVRPDAGVPTRAGGAGGLTHPGDGDPQAGVRQQPRSGAARVH